MSPIRHALLALIALAPVALLVSGCTGQSDAQAVVDRATLTAQDVVGPADATDAKSMLRKARAVLICPRVFKAGFFFGGEGGGCVLAARDGAGSWSYPAFYNMGSGSFGLQIGVQDAEFVMMILTEKGLNAILDSQFKFGADASIAVATVGASVGGSTTAAVGADIVAFAQARGLFAGISLQGSLLSSRTEANQSYYGKRLDARDIVIGMQGVNQGADPLRDTLGRVAAGSPASAPVTPAAETPGMAPAVPRGAVTQQNLVAPPSNVVVPAQPGAPKSLSLPKSN